MALKIVSKTNRAKMNKEKVERKRETNSSSKNNVSVMKGFVSCRDIGECNETKTSRASSNAVNGDGGIQNDAVLAEVEFEDIFGGVTRNASYEELRSVGIHLQIRSILFYCYCAQSLNP